MEDTFNIIEQRPREPVGWLETKLPKYVMTRLQNYIEVAKKTPISRNDKLAGNISKSLSLEDTDDWFFRYILLEFIKQFNISYPTYVPTISMITVDAPYCLNNFWVNFQKQHEFNPMHTHNGIFSFVIWVKIPTEWREQHALPISANSIIPRASDFEFHYTTMMDNVMNHPYLLDKESEGGMLFFPANLIHQVYPFYNCDEERVSISGNIWLDTTGRQ
mgnify:CR=1 FL=1